MINIDQHVHTNISHDGISTIDEYKDMAHPNIDIVKRYKELGGKIITLGSDAHKVCDLTSNFDKATDILEQCGFDELSVYHNRKPDFVKIFK